MRANKYLAGNARDDDLLSRNVPSAGGRDSFMRAGYQLRIGFSKRNYCSNLGLPEALSVKQPRKIEMPRIFASNPYIPLITEKASIFRECLPHGLYLTLSEGIRFCPFRYLDPFEK